MDEGDVGAVLELIQKRLDWIEEGLSKMREFNYLPMGRADHRPDEVAVPAEVVELVRAGKRKDAVKRYRELTGLDFLHAQSAIDGI